MERGFYHPDRGYWQTTGEPSEDILTSYPEGTIEVPIKPGSGYEWTGDAWTYVEPPVAPAPSLTRRQLLLGLLAIGITGADVEAQLGLIEDPQERAAALIEWQAAGLYNRDHPLVAELALAFDLPETQVDDLWRWAAGL